MISTKYSRNKIMAAAGYTFLVLFALLLVTKIFLPDTGDGWSNPPIFDYICTFGIGICFSLVGIILTYYAWSLNPREFVEWYEIQQTFGKKEAGQFDTIFPEGITTWSTRIAAPIGTLMGIALSVSMLLSFFEYLFR